MKLAKPCEANFSFGGDVEAAAVAAIHEWCIKTINSQVYTCIYDELECTNHWLMIYIFFCVMDGVVFVVLNFVLDSYLYSYTLTHIGQSNDSSMMTQQTG